MRGIAKIKTINAITKITEEASAKFGEFLGVSAIEDSGNTMVRVRAISERAISIASAAKAIDRENSLSNRLPYLEGADGGVSLVSKIASSKVRCIRAYFLLSIGSEDS